MRVTDVMAGAGILGVGVTGFLAGNAGAKLKEKNVNLLKIRTWEELWDILPDVGPAFLAGGLTAVDIGMTHHLDGKTIAAVAAVGAGAAEFYKRSQDKFKEIVGEEKFNEIKAEVSKEISAHIPTVRAEHPVKKLDLSKQIQPSGDVMERAIDLLEDDPKIFVLEINGRAIRFNSTIAQVIWAEGMLNKSFSASCVESVASYLEWMNLSSEITTNDNIMGWSYESIVDVTDSDEPVCINFDYYIWDDDDGQKVCTITCDQTQPMYQEELDRLYVGRN